MITRPAFAAHLRVDVLQRQGIQASGERTSMYFDGVVFITIAEAVGRGLSSEAILAAAADPDEREALAAAIDHLQRVGVLHEANDQEARTPERIFWSRRQGTRTADKGLRYSVATAGSPAAELSAILQGALRAAGLGDPTDEGSAELLVVLAEDYLHEDLGRLNARMLEAKKAWLLVRPVGIEPWIGPLFVPGATGCWECLAQRLRYNRPLHGTLSDKQTSGYLEVPQGWLPASAELAARMAAIEIAGYARTRRSLLRGSVRSINTATWTIEAHRLVRRPQCKVCGTEQPPRSPRITPSSVPIVEGVDGYRAQTPEQMLKTFEHHVSAITGVVPFLQPSAQVTKLGLYAYISGSNSAVVRAPNLMNRAGVRAYCGGKGRSEIQAKAGALAEALERWSIRSPEVAELRSQRVARYDELPLGSAVPPSALQHYGQSQYDDRERLNARDAFNRVPPPWEPDKPIAWASGWSLRDDALRYLPAQVCYGGDAIKVREHHYGFGDSNGFAAGTTLEDALLQGFFELVERDAVAIWFYNQIERPRLDLESLNDPYVRKVQGVLDRLGRDLWIVDLTHDLGLPVYAALSGRRDPRPRVDFVMGFGCHRDPRIAVDRAVAELMQLGATALDIGEEIPAAFGHDLTQWLSGATPETQAFVLAKAQAPTALPECPKPTTLRAELEHCVQVCAARGLDFIARDYTLPDIGLPVGRVIVPGLRHFWRRTGPGRLYDVPVALGWLGKPKAEAELNELDVPI